MASVPSDTSTDTGVTSAGGLLSLPRDLIGQAEGGHLGVLKWARENGCPWDEWTCAIAASKGYVEP